jgi:hypothetical protein
MKDKYRLLTKPGQMDEWHDDGSHVVVKVGQKFRCEGCFCPTISPVDHYKTCEHSRAINRIRNVAKRSGHTISGDTYRTIAEMEDGVPPEAVLIQTYVDPNWNLTKPMKNYPADPVTNGNWEGRSYLSYLQAVQVKDVDTLQAHKLAVARSGDESAELGENYKDVVWERTIKCIRHNPEAFRDEYKEWDEEVQEEWLKTAIPGKQHVGTIESDDMEAMVDGILASDESISKFALELKENDGRNKKFHKLFQNTDFHWVVNQHFLPLGSSEQQIDFLQYNGRVVNDLLQESMTVVYNWVNYIGAATLACAQHGLAFMLDLNEKIRTDQEFAAKVAASPFTLDTLLQNNPNLLGEIKAKVKSDPKFAQELGVAMVQNV